ncbi:hypothetical protein LINPERPRIM_LOCUS36609 [Linum perenne]
MKPVTRFSDPPTRNFFSDDDDEDDTGLVHGGPPRRDGGGGYYGDYSFEFHPNPTSSGFDSAEFSNGLTAEINRMMNEHAGVLLRSVDRLSSHVSRMESRTQQLEDAFDDLKESVKFYQGKTNGQLQQLQNVLTEVQDGVKDLRDKQDIAVTQLHLAEIHKSVDESQSGKKTSTIQTSSSDQTTSSIGQQVLKPPSSFTNIYNQGPASARPPLRPPANFNIASSPAPQYTVQSTYDASLPQQQYSQPLPNYPPEAAHQLVPVPQIEQLQPSYYPQQPHQTPHFPPPPAAHLPPSMVDPQVNYLSSQHHPEPVPSAALSGRSFHHHQQSNRGSGQLAPSYSYGASSSPSGSRPTTKSLQPSPTSLVAATERERSRLPTAKLLPRAIPTASAVEASSEASTGNNISRVPVDDVVDKVVAMGFRRDLVRATVKILTENGQAVDLNVVLDKLMNN